MSFFKTNLIVGGESRDPQLEVPDEREASSVMSVTSTGARIVTGSRAALFPLDTASSKSVAVAVLSGTVTHSGINVAMGHIGLSATPASQLGVLTTDVRGTAAHYIGVNTSLQLVLNDSNGNPLGQPSLDTISTTGMTSFMVVWDFSVNQTPSSGSAYITMFVNGRYQWDGLCSSSGTILDTGELWWGEYLDVAVDRGADLYGDDLTMFVSDAIAPETDAPHVYAMPKLKCHGEANLPPVGNGSHTAWGGTGSGGCTEVDDFPNDGDTTHTDTATNSVKETYRWNTANPLTSSDTVWAVHQECVLRALGAAKVAFSILYRDAAGNESTSSTAIAVGTSHTGVIKQNMSRPAGGSWVYTDFDLGTYTMYSGTASGGADAPAAGYMRDTTAAWATDAYAGYTLTCGGSTATITTNTATQLNHGGWTGGTPAGGSAYTIDGNGSDLQVGGVTPAAGSVGFWLTAMPGPVIVCYSETWDMAIGWV